MRTGYLSSTEPLLDARGVSAVEGIGKVALIDYPEPPPKPPDARELRRAAARKRRRSAGERP
mgnify:CR=1 FL=1